MFIEVKTKSFSGVGKSEILLINVNKIKTIRKFQNLDDVSSIGLNPNDSISLDTWIIDEPYESLKNRLQILGERILTLSTKELVGDERVP